LRFAFCLIAFALPVEAASLCDTPDSEAVKAAIEGRWTLTETLSLENETESMMRHPDPVPITIRDGRIETPLIDSLIGRPVMLAMADAPYDVNAVDDILDATDSAELADLVSDTPCGPEGLTQLTATLRQTEGVAAHGAMTLLPYFDDRMLVITELTLRSDETVLFLTGAGYLTPLDPAVPD